MIMSYTENPDIKCIIEFSEEKAGLSFAVYYGGKEYDLIQNGDQLSLSMIKSIAKDIVYERQADEIRPNMIRLSILP